MGMALMEGRRCFLMVLLLISANDAIKVSGGKEKVKLELYYETVCPYSAMFIVDYLPKLFVTGLIHITDLKLLPYGNADVYNGTIYCQHGKLECLLNTVHACAIDAWPDLSKYFPFINCVENLVLEDYVYRRKYPKWQTCFEKLKLDAKPVTDCLESERGKELDFLYAAKTEAIRPEQAYVPWVVVDGQPLYEDYQNFLSYICKAYKGTAAAKVCNATANVLIQKGRKIKPFVSMRTTNSKLPTISAAIISWMKKLTALV